MINKKICLLGASGVGKTSLVSRYVHQMFSEKYVTTIGVKVDKKEVDVAGSRVKLMIWDLAGEDEMETVQMRYLRGASGYLLVIDGTRPETFRTAMDIEERVQSHLDQPLGMVLLNKCDLKSEWSVTSDELAELQRRNLTWLETSAKLGERVDQAFSDLAQRMIS